MSNDIQLKKDGKSFWDLNPCGGQWGSYEEFLNWYIDTEPEMFEILTPYDYTDKKIVEIGVGQGPTINYLARSGVSMQGMDISLQSIKEAQSGAMDLGHNDRVSFWQGDAEMLPLPENCYDMVISLGVLHHTKDTRASIQEIYRILKPNGTALVMLYRSGNPKWWMVRILRGMSSLVDFFSGERQTLAKKIRTKQEESNVEGTALLELFGVPVLKAFSNRQSKQFFQDFSKVNISNYMSGFERLVDILPFLKIFTPPLLWLDKATQQQWGFYQVIEAKK